MSGNNNSGRFLESAEQYFRGSYERFVKFGGPCVYFHNACLREASAAFLSERHIELLYATLTAWGMHRMGPGKAKLTEWERFSDSIQRSGSLLRERWTPSFGQVFVTAKVESGVMIQATLG